MHGNLTAGTSTGGTNWRLPGRIGDSPIPGAGTYASNALRCAISSSGTREYFIRNTVAGDICHRAAYLYQSIDQTADYVINTELRAQDGDGGVIVRDKKGHLARVFNTNASETGQIDPEGRVTIQFCHDQGPRK